MFDTMTVTKAGGALCGAFLIFLLGKWAAESLYNTEPASHGGEEVAQAYSIDTGAAAGGEAAAEEGPDFATILPLPTPQRARRFLASARPATRSMVAMAPARI